MLAVGGAGSQLRSAPTVLVRYGTAALVELNKARGCAKPGPALVVQKRFVGPVTGPQTASRRKPQVGGRLA